MRHLEIWDLWLQREVGLGKVVVMKVEGPKNPADLMTKYLTSKEIKERLQRMGIRVRWRRWSDHEEMLDEDFDGGNIRKKKEATGRAKEDSEEDDNDREDCQEEESDYG